MILGNGIDRGKFVGLNSWDAVTTHPNFSTFIAYTVANASHAQFPKVQIPRDMPVG